MKAKLPQHPVSEVASCFYHGMLAGFLLIGLAFHVYAAAMHFRDRYED